MLDLKNLRSGTEQSNTQWEAVIVDFLISILGMKVGMRNDFPIGDQGWNRTPPALILPVAIARHCFSNLSSTESYSGPSSRI